MPLYGYNFPWSGKIVYSHLDKCIFCGEENITPHYSSIIYDTCIKCREQQKPLPEIVAEQQMMRDLAIFDYCDEHNIDYVATMRNIYKNKGPWMQRRDTPIEGPDGPSYIIYKSRKMCFDAECLDDTPHYEH